MCVVHPYFYHCFCALSVCAFAGTFKEGSKYEGGWYDGKMHGQGTLSGCAVVCVLTSHLTPHTSHLTPHTHLTHTSHTPHTSHLTPHTSHLTPHTSHLTPRTSSGHGRSVTGVWDMGVCIEVHQQEQQVSLCHIITTNVAADTRDYCHVSCLLCKT